MTVTAKCTSCGATTTADPEVARAGGWRIWDGKSVTGKDIQARVCPVCVGGREGEQPTANARSWAVGCRTCDWEWTDEYNEGPLDEKAAKDMAMDHECEPDIWVKSPEEMDAEEERRPRVRASLSVATLAGVAP